MKQGSLISFSGGRSSAMMLKIMLDNGMVDNNTIVAFANTGKEREETLEFVRDCEIQFNVKIWWVEYEAEKPLYRIVDFETASRNGEPFEALTKRAKYLPNAVQRICTGDLKIKPMNRLMKKHLGFSRYIKYMGIRADELKRYVKLKDQAAMPLFQLGVTKKQVRDFWDAQAFDLNIKDGWGNCDLCFQKGRAYTGKLVKLIREEPGRADWWIEMERKTGARFINAISYAQLKHIALNQTTLNFEDIEELEDTIDCYCG
ncbi:MAG: phosphoadenosine phosphosulfate reductase family protein [Saprospiraceae bacterium]|nr:phosphoadenosine phosphosulfate reductase family protein [Saprospiraceae bacterium]